MSDVNAKANAGNTPFLAAAKEALSKRTYYKLSDAFNSGNIKEVETLIMTWVDQAIADPLLAQLKETTGEQKEIVSDIPFEDRNQPLAGSEETPKKGVKAEKAPKPVKEVEAKVNPYEDTGIDAQTKDAIKFGTKDAFSVGAQKTLWLDLETNLGRVRKEAHLVAAHQTPALLVTVFKFGKRQVEGIQTADISVPKNGEKDQPVKERDTRDLSNSWLTFLANGEILVTWVQNAKK